MKEKVTNKILLLISAIHLFATIYSHGNILKSIVFLAFSISLFLGNKYEKWRNWLDIIAIFLFVIFLYMDWFL